MKFIRQIQTTQFAFNFPSNFPSFKTLIIHEGEKFAFPKLYSENLAGIKISFAMPTIRDHPRDVLSLILEIFRAQGSEITLLK